MKNLVEADVIGTMREEWDRRVKQLAEDIDLTMEANPEGDGNEPVISHGLKVRHKTSGVRYTVDSVGPRDVILLTPEGESFLVNQEELEKEYELA